MARFIEILGTKNTNRLFHGVRYDYTAMGECKHKFKITVEKG